MHSDILAIRDLWHVDQEMDALRAEAGELASAVEVGRKKLLDAQHERTALIERLDGVKERERKLNRKMEEYIGRRDRTRNLIDAGKASDFISAQRQYEQCAAIVDDVEVELLDVMEQVEQLEAELLKRDKTVQIAQARLNGAVARQSSRRPALEARYHELKPMVAERLAEVPHHYHSRYQDLRRRGWSAMAWIADGACEECHMAVTDQVAIEVTRGKRVHNCRGCGRFFFDVRSREPEEVDTEQI